MTTPEPESIDEAMRGMGETADYDDWAQETPDTPVARLTARLDRLPDSDALMVEKTELRAVLLLAASAERLAGERDYLVAKLEAWHAEAESLRAQRDAMETALTKANDLCHTLYQHQETTLSAVRTMLPQPDNPPKDSR